MHKDNSIDRVSFSANGKLLLTGEYLVIDGASALALPISLSQSLSTEPSDDNNLHWTASDINGIWFSGVFSLNHFEVISASNSKIATDLQHLLLKAEELNPVHHVTQGLSISTHLNFDRLLGVGSSSTLISLVASLFQTDKYKLHRLVSVGSGYDVACANYEHPIIFERKSVSEATIKPVNFMPPFADQLWFAYLGKKQNTNDEIAKYSHINKTQLSEEIKLVSDISFKLVETKDLTTFVSLIDLHEKIIGGVLGRAGIKQQQFSDFQGSVKSLGAWGGDFILVVTDKDENYLKQYLSVHEIRTVFRFKDLVLNKPVLDNDETIIRF